MTFVWKLLEKTLGTGGAALSVMVLGMLLLWGINSSYHKIRATYWKTTAEDAIDLAATAQTNATSANAGARNATKTRGEMQAGTQGVRDTTGQAVERVEADEDVPLDDADSRPLSDGSMRELQAAQDRARAAADRLQRTRRP